MQIANQNVSEHTQQKKENGKLQHDIKAREKQFNIGNKVLLHQPLVTRGRSKKLANLG